MEVGEFVTGSHIWGCEVMRKGVMKPGAIIRSIAGTPVASGATVTVATVKAKLHVCDWRASLLKNFV